MSHPDMCLCCFCILYLLYKHKMPSKFIYIEFCLTIFFFFFFSEATRSLPTISPLPPPLPLHCHPARHRQHWLMSWYRPQSQKLTPAVRWTGPTTPMNPDTASATRCVHVTSLSCGVLIVVSLLLLVILILD